MLGLCSVSNRQTNGYGATVEQHEHGNTAVLGRGTGAHVLIPLFLSHIHTDMPGIEPESPP